MSWTLQSSCSWTGQSWTSHPWILSRPITSTGFTTRCNILDIFLDYRRGTTGAYRRTVIYRCAPYCNIPKFSKNIGFNSRVVARLRLLSITISLSSESMNIGVDDEVADIWLPEAVVWLCWLC